MWSGAEAAGVGARDKELQGEFSWYTSVTELVYLTQNS